MVGKKHKVVALFCALAGMAAVPARLNADSINGTGGGWQNWSASNLYEGSNPTPGTPYWNNFSGDGPQGNIGWCLTGGGPTCNLGTTYGTLPYYGTASGGAVSSVYFSGSGSPMTVTVAGITTNEKTASQYDTFGYYVVPASGSPTLIPLFNTLTATVGSSATLSLAAGTNYGFYIENVQGGDTGTNYYFLMNGGNYTTYDGSALSSSYTDTLQHFAVFQTTTGYLIGDVDGVACNGTTLVAGSSPCELTSQFDYNDFTVTLAPSAPEPATAGLMAVSLLFLGLAIRRKFRPAA